ncbi:protease modulator HflC [Corticimicrobacter populi]|uniref:Protein HflC n=1 Tax=Corticimicrobacter populi TaxID=2175229 RepID=A0A2V1K5B5_9BURK|nr:protease modulator HflC [Corticimicrobacter populi]PWF24839.1 protease modulator HflC [Corticimicrobacter populi]QDQ86842.1 protease modulator HflC [Alcaligenaceae bacterium SJ-26]
MHRLVPIVVGLLIAVAAFSSMTFIVRERDYALVFALGEVRRVIDKPGLYFKLPPPFQNVVLLDKRVLSIESPDAERIQTSEKKNLLIDSYIKWRIADPRLYYVTFGATERAAQERLLAQIRDALNASVNVRTVNDVVSKERDKIMSEVLSNVARRAAPLGVEVVDVRLKRIEFAPEISESVYNRMMAERTQAANNLRSVGAAESERIRANADRQRDEILADAYAKAQAVHGEGDAEAAGIYAEAFEKDPEFYRFYKSLDAYKQAFKDESDVLVVDPSSDFFRFLKSAEGAPQQQ